jgi:outer membrane protein
LRLALCDLLPRPTGRAYASAILMAALVGVGAMGFATNLRAQTLFDAMIAAYQTNPTLQAQRAGLRSADEGVPQARSNYRPTVTFDGSAAQETRDSSSSPSTSLTPLSANLRVSQPLYRGGRTVASVRQAENIVRAARADLLSTEQSVLLLVVTAYLNVLRDQAVVQLNRSNEDVLTRQLQAARDRFEVGEVTRTDVAQAEARLSRATSERIQAQGNVTSSRANYRRAVGAEIGQIEAAPRITDIPASYDAAVQTALEENPLLVSAQFTEAASRDAIEVSRGSLRPTVSVNGDLSYNDELQFRNSSTESAAITARLNVPLYQAGSVFSQIRQNRQINSQRRIQVEETRRQVIESVTTAWSRLTTASAQIVSQLEQVRAAELALEGVEQEAEVGSRTTLDVLDAQQELLSAQVALVRAQRDEYVAAFEVKSSIGRLTVAALGLGVEAFDEEVYYNRVRNRWFGTNGTLTGIE